MAMMLMTTMVVVVVVVMVTISIDIEGDMELFPRGREGAPLPSRSMMFNVDDK
jgi:hypothetical protein